jgi:hypothetical protein
MDFSEVRPDGMKWFSLLSNGGICRSRPISSVKISGSATRTYVRHFFGVGASSSDRVVIRNFEAVCYTYQSSLSSKTFPLYVGRLRTKPLQLSVFP